MKSVNISFSNNVYCLFKKLVGKEFVKFSCNKFIYSTSVYGIIGIYIANKIYRFTNFIDVVDYYSKMEDVAVFKFEETNINGVKSAIASEEMIDVPINKVIKKIEVINENQKQYRNDNILYDNWVTRGVIFYFDDETELSFEKDIWFSEEIYVEQGKKLIDKFASTDKFSEAWEPESDGEISEYSGRATRETIIFTN